MVRITDGSHYFSQVSRNVGVLGFSNTSATVKAAIRTPSSRIYVCFSTAHGSGWSNSKFGNSRSGIYDRPSLPEQLIQSPRFFAIRVRLSVRFATSDCDTRFPIVKVTLVSSVSPVRKEIWKTSSFVENSIAANGSLGLRGIRYALLLDPSGLLRYVEYHGDPFFPRAVN